MENKVCYICLPISGAEDTAIERANKAADYVRNELGMIPLTPMEINDESQETLNNADRPIEFFMGNDIKALIGRCQAIYICDGWENSKGCRVEVECAKQYYKEFFYQTIPSNLSLKEAFSIRYNELDHLYLNAIKKYGRDSEQASRYSDNMEDFINIFLTNFKIY